MFGDRLLAGDLVEEKPDVWTQRLRLNWYRSLPLSCIELIELRIDGCAVPIHQIDAELEGHHFSLAALSEQEGMWFVQDLLALTVRDVPLDGAQILQVTIRSRIPYVIVGQGEALTQTDIANRPLEASHV